MPTLPLEHVLYASIHIFFHSPLPPCFPVNAFPHRDAKILFPVSAPHHETPSCKSYTTSPPFLPRTATPMSSSHTTTPDEQHLVASYPLWTSLAFPSP